MTTRFTANVQLRLPSLCTSSPAYTIYYTDAYRMPKPKEQIVTELRPVCYVEIEPNSGVLTAENVADAIEMAARNVGRSKDVKVTYYDGPENSIEDIRQYALSIDRGSQMANIIVQSPRHLIMDANAAITDPRGNAEPDVYQHAWQQQLPCKHRAWRTVHIRVNDDARCSLPMRFRKRTYGSWIKGGDYTILCDNSAKLASIFAASPDILFEHQK